MIVGGYSLHLYCRHGSCGADDGCKGPSGFLHDQSAEEFSGSNEPDCNRTARQRGWVFHRDGDVSCPWCSGSIVSRERAKRKGE